MNKTSSVFTASILSLGVYLYWLGAVDWAFTLDNVSFYSCLGISVIGLIYYIRAYWRPSDAWVGGDNCISLGLLGTVVGIIIAAYNFGSPEELFKGIALSLMTTGTGLICNLILYNHGIFLGLHEEENLQ